MFAKRVNNELSKGELIELYFIRTGMFVFKSHLSSLWALFETLKH